MSIGLDISFRQEKLIRCPKCGELVTREHVNGESSGGRIWNEILERLGYKCDEWYAEDMELTQEQIKEVYEFVRNNQNHIYDSSFIMVMLATAMVDGDTVTINADW